MLSSAATPPFGVPTRYRQPTLTAATPNTFLWIGTLKMQWQPRRVEEGKGQKRKVVTGWLQPRAKQANECKSSRVPLTWVDWRRSRGPEEMKPLPLKHLRTSGGLDMKITPRQRLCFHLSLHDQKNQPEPNQKDTRGHNQHDKKLCSN